jgi:hypothetical protein
VTIYASADPMHARMLVEILADAGVSARLIGTQHAALVGAASHIFALRIEVPAAEAARARELIDGFLAAEPLSDRDPAVREGAPLPRRRSPWLVAGAALALLAGFSAAVGSCRPRAQVVAK